MGRESRQARRARERRQQERKGRGRSGPNWSIVGGAAIVVIAVLFFGWLAFANKTSGSSSSKSTPSTGLKPIDGLQCNFTEQITYHVHAHLEIFDSGKLVKVPAQIGIETDHDCLYWVHTHDSSGIIHIEAPHHIVPTIKSFFDVWHKPLTSAQIGPAAVKRGQQVRVWVNEKPYSGALGKIRLHRHTDVTVEIAKPFFQPKKYNYHGL